jgi:hypothetical protein
MVVPFGQKESKVKDINALMDLLCASRSSGKDNNVDYNYSLNKSVLLAG